MDQSGADPDLGKYRLLLRLGRGGMAEVFVAVARGPAGFNKLVVVKRLLADLAGDEGFRAMFLQEARLAARLNHPNVVQTYEVGAGEGDLYLAMEYLEGQPLSRIHRALAASESRLRPATCVRIACDVLAGLHHAHELRDFDGTPLRVIHRDVSPQNVFVTYEGQVKLLDFGIAKAERSSAKTQPGWLKGKYAYMAPEQFVDDDIDRRVDVFTTAIVLWELLAGRSLFGGGTEAMVVRRLLQEPIPRLSAVVPDADPILDEILARALDRDKERRFPTALAMREALAAWLAQHTSEVEDLGRLVSRAFSDAREEVERQVAEQLGGSLRLPSASVPELDVPSVMSLRSATPAASLGPIAISTPRPAPASPAPAPATVLDVRRLFTDPGRPRLALFAAGATLVLAAVLGLATRGSSGAAAPAAASPPPQPTALAVAPPVERAAAPTWQRGDGTREAETPPAPAPGPRAPAPSRVVAPRWSPPRPPPPPPASSPAPASLAVSAAPEPPPASAKKPAPSPPVQEGRRFRTTW